jgi:hypothetical protein
MMFPFAVVLSAAQGQTVDQVMLDTYLTSRIKMRGDLKEHKNANDLQWSNNRGRIHPYFVQRVKVGDRHLGVVGFSVTYMSQPGDMLTDLVWVEGGTIKLIRPLVPVVDHVSTPMRDRLFWSEGNILVRQPTGFEILDVQAKQVGFIASDATMRFAGRSSSGDIAMLRLQKGRLSMVWLNPKTRKFRTVTYRDRFDPQSDMRYARETGPQIEVVVEPPNSKLTNFILNLQTGRVVSRKLVDPFLGG